MQVIGKYTTYKVNNHIDDIRSSHVAPVSSLLLFVEGASIHIGAFRCLPDMLTYQNFCLCLGGSEYCLFWTQNIFLITYSGNSAAGF